MTDLQELESGDELTIDTDVLSGRTFEVFDTSSESLGITDVVAVVLVCGSERYMIEWATHSDTAGVVEIDGDGEWEIEPSDVQIE